MIDTLAPLYDFTDEWGIRFVRRIWHLEYKDLYQLHWMACPVESDDPEAWAHIPVCYCTQFSGQYLLHVSTTAVDLVISHIEGSFRRCIAEWRTNDRFPSYGKPISLVADEDFRYLYIVENMDALKESRDGTIHFDQMIFVREGNPPYVSQVNPFATLSFPHNLC